MKKAWCIVIRILERNPRRNFEGTLENSKKYREEFRVKSEEIMHRGSLVHSRQLQELQKQSIENRQEKSGRNVVRHSRRKLENFSVV